MEKVGRYEIRELIGQGAMAKVFKAYDPEIDRTLAIKVLHPELVSDDEYRQRFLREAKGAGILSHSNIVTVFDVGEDQAHNPYLAMELVEGKTLAELIKESDEIPISMIVDIGIQLARALDYAHRKGIVHRDVKPSNVMLVRDTNTVKVADFGICHIANSDMTQRTQAGSVLGTPHYMSPEQVQGQKVDARSDIFSAGVVLYQLLSKTLPFQGDSLITVAYKITKEEPVPPLDKLRRDAPLSLRRVIERALRKQPERRFQTGEELAQALIKVAREIRETGHEDKRRRIPLRLRWAAIMAALVAVTMIITAAILQRQQYDAMMKQVTDYGSSFARFMAAQNATPLLGEDWAAIEVFIQNTTTGQNFAHLLVLDRQGVIRGSSDPAQLNSAYSPPKAVAVDNPDNELTISKYSLPDGREVIDFGAPALFQGQNVGMVHLGVLEAPLTEVANLTLWLMIILVGVTSAAVALGVYWLTYRLSEPLTVLRNSLQEIAKGRYDYRIGESRDDEFGELYAAFDEAAQALQGRHEPHLDKEQAAD